MSDALIFLLYALLAMMLFFGTVPLAVAAMLGDKQRIARVLDVYIEVFKASADAFIAFLKFFQRRRN